MENNRQKELEILIAIRNSPATPADEFHKIFGEDWLDYKKSMISLYNNGLLMHASHNTIPGLKIWELTGVGNRVLTDLIHERSNDLSRRLTEPQNSNKLSVNDLSFG